MYFYPCVYYVYIPFYQLLLRTHWTWRFYLNNLNVYLTQDESVDSVEHFSVCVTFDDGGGPTQKLQVSKPPTSGPGWWKSTFWNILVQRFLSLRILAWVYVLNAGFMENHFRNVLVHNRKPQPLLYALHGETMYSCYVILMRIHGDGRSACCWSVTQSKWLMTPK